MRLKSWAWVLLLLTGVLFAGTKPYITTLEGEKLNGHDLKGRWLILHYWASWCDICMSEMPVMEKFYQGLPKDKVRLFLVNYDQLSKNEIYQILKKSRVSIPSLEGHPAQLFGIKNADALPMTVVVDPNGKVKDLLYGPQTLADLKREIR
ncbi:MAG: TlpA family protein disulfide reductase [Gammaproteobacteria bacterium]|nr:TlpA family protein disulfide reductase [Gammaproteobacteria bacterium]